MVKWAEEYRGKKQTPWLSLQGGTKLVLAEKVGRVTKPSSSPTGTGNPEAEMWELVKGTAEASDIEDFLQAFPRRQFVAVARLKLKQLQRQQPKITGLKNKSGMVLIPTGPSTPPSHRSTATLDRSRFEYGYLAVRGI